MSTTNLDKAILDCIGQHQQSGNEGVAASLIQQQIGRPRPTVNRALARLVESGELIRLGAGRSITYSITYSFSYQKTAKAPSASQVEQPQASYFNTSRSSPGFQWSNKAHKVVAALAAPWARESPLPTSALLSRTTNPTNPPCYPRHWPQTCSTQEEPKTNYQRALTRARYSSNC